MEPDSRTAAGRSLLVYLVIGVVLVAAIVVGILWLKQRSEQAATNGQQVAQEEPANVNHETQPGDEESASSDEPAHPHESSEEEAGGAVAGSSTPPDQSLPDTVPSTGTGSVLLPAIAIGLCIFAAIMYTKSRRRLWSVVS